jgi:hypothetical protein
VVRPLDERSHISARRVLRNKIVVAIARELAGFVWAIAQQVKPK